MAIVIAAASFGLGYVAGNNGRSSETLTGTATSHGPGVVNETMFIHVVNSTSGEPISNESLTAGPASSLNDISYTWGLNIVATINECVHEVPNGAIVEGNGMVVSNGTTTTYSPCPLKTYDTNASGWVTISDQHAAYFFIEIGTVLTSSGCCAQVVAVEGSQTYVTAPFPEGNFTVSSTGESA